MLYLVYYENKCKNNKIEMPIYCTTNEPTKDKIVDAYEAQNPDYKLSVKTFPINTQPETKSVFFLKFLRIQKIMNFHLRLLIVF